MFFELCKARPGCCAVLLAMPLTSTGVGGYGNSEIPVLGTVWGGGVMVIVKSHF